MYMKYDHTQTTLYSHIDNGNKVYKNTLVHGYKQTIDYKLHRYTKLYNKALISQLWLNHIDSMGWDELAEINRAEWIDNKRIELGIKGDMK